MPGELHFTCEKNIELIPPRPASLILEYCIYFAMSKRIFKRLLVASERDKVNCPRDTRQESLPCKPPPSVRPLSCKKAGSRRAHPGQAQPGPPWREVSSDDGRKHWTIVRRKWRRIHENWTHHPTKSMNNCNLYKLRTPDLAVRRSVNRHSK